MSVLEFKIGKNMIFQQLLKRDSSFVDPKIVRSSWDNSFSYKQENIPLKIEGLRSPQLGAIFAIKSHWSVSCEPATIVMPTGTGKTETMMSVIISEKCVKVFIIVPSHLLRSQISEKCVSLGILKKIGVIDTKVINPVVACFTSSPSSVDELKEILDKSNIIVSTMSLVSKFSDSYLDVICSMCTELIVDEAHHIAAKTWHQIKKKFQNNRILQFTATPFRNDGKKVDGKIIYNFPLSLAQEQGYFEPINFKPVFEFDDVNSDLAIAECAISQLDEDINNGYSHIVLVRASTKQRSSELFTNVYSKYYKKYNPVLINSDLSVKQRKEAMAEIGRCEAKIIVCVDMFGEGIDIPNLKIAAIHDKYKSLPITLQFIGRFARSKDGLGNATVIANIANDDVKDALRELYSQDSDWNLLLKTMSSTAIGKEISLQELAEGFSSLGIRDVNIEQLIPKVSMIAFRSDDAEWKWENWTKVFNEDKCRCCVNEDRKILVIIEMEESKIEWTRHRETNNINWQLHILYWNPDKKMIFVNSTEKSICEKFVGTVFNRHERIKGEIVFRSLYGINRLMLATVGLNSAINGPIRYKMFAGIDIAQGLTESQMATCIKSNLFGVGYNGSGKVSIGCSYKGTIWSRWIESVDFWINWCNDIADKIMNESINVDDILRGALIPTMIEERPSVIPLSIEWPIDLTICNEDRYKILTNFTEFHIYDVEIGLLTVDETSPLKFYIGNDSIREEYELVFNKIIPDVHYRCTKSENLSIKFGKHEMSLIDFFKENPPRIKFVDQSTLETNLYVQLKSASIIQIDTSNIEVWNWKDVNIQKESQGEDKEESTVQYRVISKLKGDKDCIIIFDDDDPGEIADVVVIKEQVGKILFEFYHCKFSHGKKPGARVADLYEVCGQAEKSILWKQDGKAIIARMIRRENDRIKKGKVSRFELGNLRKLNEIKNKLSKYDFDIKIAIVQPGINSKIISKPMNQILCGTKAYLMDTYGLSFKVICS